MTDRIFGLLVVVLAVAYGYAAETFTRNFSDPLGPAFFPQLLCVPLGLLGAYLLLRPDPEPDWVLGWPLAKQVATGIVLIIYAFALMPLGFIVATSLCGIALAALLGAKPVQAVSSGVAMGVGFYVLFDKLLDLPLPMGILSGVMS